MSSARLNQVLANRTTTIVKPIALNEIKPIVKTIVNHKGYKCSSVDQVDVMVNDAMAAGVCNNQMRGWYCKQAYKLGGDLFTRCVSQAKEGTNKVKLFSYLLKKAEMGGQ